MRYRFAYEEKKDGTLTIRRVYGRERAIVLPEQIGGKVVTEVSAYAFSESAPSEAGCHYWYGEARRKREESWGPVAGDWQEDAPYEFTGWERPPADWETEEFAQPLCGSSLCGVWFPDSVKKIGRYLFYNCDGLRWLRFPSTLRDIGGGAFNGCRKVTDLAVRVFDGQKSGLREILTELNETLTVHYYLEGEDEEAARLLFPEYFEEAVENTPARILETHMHGCGHRYRYCFLNTAFQFEEYDRLFLWVREQEPLPVAVTLALSRLRYPLRLSERARDDYLQYVRGKLPEAVSWLLKEKRGEELRYLATLPELGQEELAGMLEAASQAKRTELVSLLMEESRRRFKPAKRSFSF